MNSAATLTAKKIEAIGDAVIRLVVREEIAMSEGYHVGNRLLIAETNEHLRLMYPRFKLDAVPNGLKWKAAAVEVYIGTLYLNEGFLAAKICVIEHIINPLIENDMKTIEDSNICETCEYERDMHRRPICAECNPPMPMERGDEI